MKKTIKLRFVESLVILPIMTATTGLGGLPSSVVNSLPTQVVVSTTAAKAVDPTLKLEGDAIDAYFAKRDMPLVGSGMKMAQVAADNDLDWRLIPAIAVRESTGGKNACDKVNNNPFGWASCKVGFKSIDQAIDTIALNLSGNNPNTASHYDNKTTKQILNAYNPPSVVPLYAKQVMSIMDAIGVPDMAATTPSNINA